MAANSTDAQQSRIEGLVSNTTGQPQAGAAVIVGTGDQQLATVQTDTSGRYLAAGLAAGSYWVITGDGGAAIAGIQLDGTSTRIANLTVPATAGYRYVVITKRLLPREETGNQRRFYGRVLNEAGAGLNGITVEMAWEGAGAGTQFPRVTTPRDYFKEAGNFEFLHSEGNFLLRVVQGDWPSDVADNLQTVNVPGREGEPITYEVNFQLRPSGAAVGTGSLSGIVTNGAGLGLTLWQGDPEQVGQPGKRSWAVVLPANGAYTFTSLPAGPFTLVLEGEGVIHAFTLAAGASTTFNYVVGTPPPPPPPPPPPGEKALASYWLLGRSAQGAAHLSLLLSHLRSNGLTAGVRLDEAMHAAAVAIVGGEDVASAADEQALLAAGCQVQRLPADPFALAEMLRL